MTRLSGLKTALRVDAPERAVHTGKVRPRSWDYSKEISPTSQRGIEDYEGISMHLLPWLNCFLLTEFVLFQVGTIGPGLGMMKCGKLFD